MTKVLHPRPNPIVAAMYTLRDLDADVIVMHGPAGCGFMASRRLEEAGVRVVTTGMQEGDLIFGAEQRLIDVLKKVSEDFHPELVGVVGTCASMIIGENLDGAIKSAGIGCTVLPIDVHGCSGPNTTGAIRVLEVAADKGVISKEEFERQQSMLNKATLIEKERGLTSKSYLEPHYGVTKLSVALKVVNILKQRKRVAVVMNAKKETAYGFADILRATEFAHAQVGGEVEYAANLDERVGLPRIRRYASNILRDLEASGVKVDFITGGLDEYPVAGEKAADFLSKNKADLTILAGLPHAIPNISKTDILVTDQPRELRNYVENGFEFAVGEISTHAAVMRTSSVLHCELGDTIREVVEKGYE